MRESVTGSAATGGRDKSRPYRTGVPQVLALVLVGAGLILAPAAGTESVAAGRDPGELAVAGQAEPAPPGAAGPVRELPMATVVVRSRVVQRIEAGASAYPTREARVIMGGEEWAGLWRQMTGNMTPAAPLPPVDFERFMVIAAFMGTQRSGGYGLRIRRIVELPERLRVEVSESVPEGCPTTMALTHPADVVYTERSDKPVEVVVERTVYACSATASWYGLFS
jgi:hypothetical protein